jgi:hypothetical protein
MARFAEYVDADSYLPGDVARAGTDEYRQEPQTILDYIARKQRKFKPASNASKDASELFQTFLNLQSNPERLFSATAKMPSEPFNISQYTAMGV